MSRLAWELGFGGSFGLYGDLGGGEGQGGRFTTPDNSATLLLCGLQSRFDEAKPHEVIGRNLMQTYLGHS